MKTDLRFLYSYHLVMEFLYSFFWFKLTVYHRESFRIIDELQNYAYNENYYVEKRIDIYKSLGLRKDDRELLIVLEQYQEAELTKLINNYFILKETLKHENKK